MEKKSLSCLLKQSFIYWVTCVSFCIFRLNKSIPSIFHYSLHLLNLLFLSLPSGLFPICLHLSYRAHFQFWSQYLKPRWSQDVSHVLPYLRAREAPVFNAQTSKVNLPYSEMAFLCLQQSYLRIISKRMEAALGFTNYFHCWGFPKKGKHIYFEKQVISRIWGWESLTPSKTEAAPVQISPTSASPLWMYLFCYCKSWFATEILFLLPPIKGTSVNCAFTLQKNKVNKCWRRNKLSSTSLMGTQNLWYSTQILSQAKKLVGMICFLPQPLDYLIKQLFGAKRIIRK